MLAFDSRTGLLVLSALRTSTQPGGPLQLGMTELVGTRRLAVPGLGAPVPSWLAARPTLSYVGSQDFVNPLLPGPPLTSTVSWSTTITATGSTWATYESSGTVTAFGASVPLADAGATGGAGPYWWDPAALASMVAGQVLDTDPVTGHTLAVGAVTPTVAGRTVTITGTMPGYQTTMTFDVATGVMTGQQVADGVSGSTTTVALQSPLPTT
jgi:hypothetical protein